MGLRKKEIPKDGGKVRILSIPSIRDRVVQGALKLILEPIFEADFQSGSYGYRPKRTAHEAVNRVAHAIVEEKTRIIDIDLSAYFDNVQHSLLLEKVAQRIKDGEVMHLLKMIVKATGKKGVPQGGVILLDSHPRHGWLVKAVEKRLREELAKLNVTINEEKSRTVNLSKGESFSFLGFEYRLILSRNQMWRPQYTPRLKKRKALFVKLREIFRRFMSQPVERVIELINPILRGWVNYFAVGHSSRCFAFVKDWV